jgi:hypothetical protein
MAPLRKNRLVGRMDRGRRLFSRQMLPHREPTEADKMAVRLSTRLDAMFVAVTGFAKKALYLMADRANTPRVMVRASGGTEFRRWCRNAVPQMGVLGWSRAHDNEAMPG